MPRLQSRRAQRRSCEATESQAAVYFKAPWASPFDPGVTKPAPFTFLDGQSAPVPMMSQHDPYLMFAYRRGDGFEAARLPYRAKSLGLYIFLPERGSDLPSLLGRLNADNWERWVQGFKPVEMELTLPRFQTTYETDLIAPLTALGMASAIGGGADFTPMGIGRFGIGVARHKTFLEMNEEGTEAAAATGIGMPGGSMPEVKRVVFKVDRPFFFAIRDDETGTLLFLGAIVDPR